MSEIDERAVSEEPDFISQTAEPMEPKQRLDWFRWRASEAAQKGATFFRFSYHPEQTDILLFEGWKIRPIYQGEPGFQMISYDAVPLQESKST